MATEEVKNMSKRSDTDKAIHNIMKWLEQPEFQEKHAIVIDEHIAPACKHLDVNHEELSQEIIEHGFDGMLFGIMFEDFLGRPLLPDNNNIVDDYLKRRGWRESVRGRRYLQQLAQSTLSLYEIVEVSPGHYCDVRDIVRGGETIRVLEKMGTQNLVKWDRIAARILESNGKHIFSGGILPFPQEAGQSLLKVLSKSRKQFNKEYERLIDKKTRALASVNPDDEFLQNACPFFTSIWLIHTLEGLHAPLPEMVNYEGDALEFTESRFPFLAEQLEEIASKLDAATGWERDNPDEHTWNWSPTDQKMKNKAKKGISIQSFQGGQQLISGTLEMSPGVLKLTTNSRERAQLGQDKLETLLHGLIGPALSTIQTPEQLLSENETQQQNNGKMEPTDTIDPELAAQITEDYLDQYYRECLDEPIPVLGDKTPRQCASRKKDRAKVIEWLKHLENNELRRAARQGGKAYDSRWMWEELKLEKY